MESLLDWELFFTALLETFTRVNFVTAKRPAKLSSPGKVEIGTSVSLRAAFKLGRAHSFGQMVTDMKEIMSKTGGLASAFTIGHWVMYILVNFSTIEKRDVASTCGATA